MINLTLVNERNKSARTSEQVARLKFSVVCLHWMKLCLWNHISYAEEEASNNKLSRSLLMLLDCDCVLLRRQSKLINHLSQPLVCSWRPLRPLWRQESAFKQHGARLVVASCCQQANGNFTTR